MPVSGRPPGALGSYRACLKWVGSQAAARLQNALPPPTNCTLASQGTYAMGRHIFSPFIIPIAWGGAPPALPRQHPSPSAYTRIVPARILGIALLKPGSTPPEIP
jgi:hypothetical protein